MGATRPPIDYLATCSQMSLESVELSRLNLAANLRKEFQEILNEWIESEVDARLARSILEWRRAQDICPSTPAIEAAAKPPQFEQLAIAFLPEGRALPASSASERDRQSVQDGVPPGVMSSQRLRTRNQEAASAPKHARARSERHRLFSGGTKALFGLPGSPARSRRCRQSRRSRLIRRRSRKPQQ